MSTSDAPEFFFTTPFDFFATSTDQTPVATSTDFRLLLAKSKYSFPDQAHIKIDTGNLSVIMEYTLSNNELTLINRNPIFKTVGDNTPYVLKLKKIE